MPSLIACLDDVRSAYNVGSVFRTCDAVGAYELWLCGYTPFPPHPKLQKTALGSLISVTWRHHCATLNALQYAKTLGFQIVVMETLPQAQSIFSHAFIKPTLMVFGNEVSGVDLYVCNLADVVLSIPQHGAKESLNIATAAGIALYEFRRQHPLNRL